jgi:hypothetical protein
MKFMIPFLIAALPVASVAQSQSGAATGVPSVAIPKTTGVLAIQTAKQGVTPQQIMAVMPSQIRATVKLYFDGKIRHGYSRRDGKGVIFLVDAKTVDEARAVIGNSAAREGTVDGSRVRSHRTLDAAKGIDGPRSAAVNIVPRTSRRS